MRAVPTPNPPVADRPSAVRFAESVRAVVTAARRRGLRPPVFRAPPRLPGADRTIRRRSDGGVVVAVRVAGRPFAAVQADVVDGVVAANRLDPLAAEQFRRAAWAALAALDEAPSSRPAGVVGPVPGVPGVTPVDSPEPERADPDGPAAAQVA